MKLNKFSYSLLLLTCFACIDATDFSMEEPMLIEQNVGATSEIGTAVNAFEKSGMEVFTFDSDQSITVSAYVISSDEAGNFYKSLIIQDSQNTPKNGLEIKIDLRSYYTKYNFGRRILLKLSGLSMVKEKGKYVVGYLSGRSLVDIPEALLDDHIMRTAETAEIEPMKITMEMIGPNLINTYVAIEQVQFLKSDLGKSYASEVYDKFNGERLIEQCDNLAKCYLYTSSYADFSTVLVPQNRIRLQAVLTSDSYSGETVLVLNSPEDIDLLDDERCDPEFFICPEVPDTERVKQVYFENFETLASTKDLGKIGWQNVNVNFANGRFKKRSRDENTFVQISAYNSKEFVMEVWLVSPQIDLDNSKREILSFDTRSTFEEGELLTCWFSTDFDENVREANWQQLDVHIGIGTADGSNEEFEHSGAVNLDCVEGKVRLAFRYIGADPGASTTYDLDNILILGEDISD